MKPKTGLVDSDKLRHANLMVLFYKFWEDHYPGESERGMLKKFAEYVGLSDRYLSHMKCGRKPISAKNARQIEQAMGMTHGWMDLPQGDNLSLVDEGEHAFADMAMTLYRNDPTHAKAWVMAELKAQLTAKKPAKSAKPAAPAGKGKTA